MSRNLEPTPAGELAVNGPMVEAVEEWLAEVEDAPVALAAAVRVLASAVDTDATNASLWKQFLDAYEALSSVVDGSDVIDIRGKLRAAMGDTA